jgi:hypothetical protein
MRQCQRIEAGMVEKIREILLTRYIGSILVALLCWQALVVLVERVVQTMFWIINDQRTRSVLGGSHAPFPWERLISAFATISLYVLTAYWLARWLYPAAVIALTEGGEELPKEQA